MLRLMIVFIMSVLLLNSCGVNTSSSSSDSANDSNNNGTPIIELDLIDPNPIVDSNISSDNPNTGDGDAGEVDTGTDTIKENSSFDTLNAIYDPNACDAATYYTARDASYNGDKKGENGTDYFSVEGEGLSIASAHAEGDPSLQDKTWVTLYYKHFPSEAHFGLQGVTHSSLQSVFYLTYDVAWSDESISGIDNTVYVRSQKSEKPSCYRVVLENVVGTNNKIQKVYR